MKDDVLDAKLPDRPKNLVPVQLDWFELRQDDLEKLWPEATQDDLEAVADALANRLMEHWDAELELAVEEVKEDAA